MSEEDRARVSDWTLASMAAAIVAVDPVALGGVLIRAKPGPVRDAWLDLVRDSFQENVPFRKLPIHATADRLFGGLDLSATLATGKPVIERGMLALSDGGMVVVPMAERMSTAMAAQLGIVFDTGEVAIERDGMSQRHSARFAMIALDESEDDEPPPPPSLGERLGIHIDLSTVGLRDLAGDAFSRAEINAARVRLRSTTVPDEIAASLCQTAVALGIVSLRPPIFALRAAIAAAALHGRDRVSVDDVKLAVGLVLAPHATVVPMDQQQPDDEDNANSPPEQEAPDKQGENDKDNENETMPDASELTEMLLAAAKAALPPKLLRKLGDCPVRPTANALSGKSGRERFSHRRGRPAGSKRGLPRGGARLNLIETLRAAAPWQKLRRASQSADEPDARSTIRIRADDFRIQRLKAGTQAVTIFAVDASGSTALERLGEAKGAVELLLADCYIRRDEVALIAFRGQVATTLLPPTRSLTRAKRSLAALAGGGGTPLALGIEAVSAMAGLVRRKGAIPLAVFLTDGKANVTMAGKGGRDKAQADATEAAKRLRAQGVASLVIDTGARPQRQASRLAEDMAAQYLPLPRGDATSISDAVKSVTGL